MPLVLLHSLHLPISSSSSSSSSFHRPIDTSKPSSNSHFLRFRVSHRQKLQYLQSLGIVAAPKPASVPPSSPASVDRALAVVHFLKSKGFSDSNFRRLCFLCPSIFFSSSVDVAPVFAFLAHDLSATPDQSVHLVLRCPDLLLADPDLRLRPTLRFLRQLGVKHNLTSPTNLSAHLLNTPVDKLFARIRFLEGVGLSYEDAAGICARFPAIFGYSVENNLRPKVEYLVRVMGGSAEELKGFPQFFGFSLEKRIRPRHLHLKARGVRIPLQRLLLWGDERFYAKWK